MSTTKPRLLAVEDEFKVALFIRKGLETQSFSVTVAADGHEGKRLIGAERFDLVILDDRLEDAFRLQRKFVSNASYELRTPLTAITGQLEVALLAGDDLSELRATVQSVTPTKPKTTSFMG